MATTPICFTSAAGQLCITEQEKQVTTTVNDVTTQTTQTVVDAASYATLTLADGTEHAGSIGALLITHAADADRILQAYRQSAETLASVVSAAHGAVNRNALKNIAMYFAPTAKLPVAVAHQLHREGFTSAAKHYATSLLHDTDPTQHQPAISMLFHIGAYDVLRAEYVTMSKSDQHILAYVACLNAGYPVRQFTARSTQAETKPLKPVGVEPQQCDALVTEKAHRRRQMYINAMRRTATDKVFK